MKNKTFRIAFAVTLTCLISLSTQAVWADDDGKFSLTSGFDYSSGSYGTSTTTDITSIPLIGKYEADLWSLSLTVPYVSISGNGTVVPGIGEIHGKGKGKSGVGTTTTTRRTTESGLGDIVAAGTYNLFAGSENAPVIDFTGKVKFGTADENKGLGTGENDYSGQFDLYKSFGNFTALGTVGYKVYGDNSSAPLDNVFFGSVGGTYKLSQSASAGLIYDYRPAIVSHGSDLSEMTAFVNYKLTKNWKAQGYLVKGFADGSPEYGVGALVGYVF